MRLTAESAILVTLIAGVVVLIFKTRVEAEFEAVFRRAFGAEPGIGLIPECPRSIMVGMTRTQSANS